MVQKCGGFDGALALLDLAKFVIRVKISGNFDFILAGMPNINPNSNHCKISGNLQF